ncbi:MAG: hypothetical protein NTY20_04130 [Candidatus Aenigmarchaeota archaeon]|nr:hypothetical protein [Candidatus Aenigmarchaeota archaeon]
MQTKLTVALLAVLALAVFTFSQSSEYLTGHLTRTGQLIIGNSPPAVLDIYMNNQHATNDPNDVTINPIENTTRNVTIKVTIEDANGNCNTFTSNNGTAYLCNGVVACNSSTANHTVSLVYNSTDGQWGTGNKYCNMSGNPEGAYFYELNGTWTVNVTVTDGIVNSTASIKNWTYGELAAFGYAAGGTISMGTLNLEQWNNGTGQEQARNIGNIVLDLKWNATNFTGQTYSDTLNITGSNYIIDDDALSPDDTGNLEQKFINESSNVKVTFVPASGLLRCTSVACSNQNSTFDVYWHIYVPSGLLEDTYTNSIEVASTYH